MYLNNNIKMNKKIKFGEKDLEYKSFSLTINTLTEPVQLVLLPGLLPQSSFLFPMACAGNTLPLDLHTGLDTSLLKCMLKCLLLRIACPKHL